MVIDENLLGNNGPNGGEATGLEFVADGIVVSSRIRLARNIADFPFINACSDDQRAEIESTVKAGLGSSQGLSQLTVVDSDQLELLERQFLMELQTVVGVDLEVSSETPPVPDELATNDGVTATKTFAGQETIESNAVSSLTLNEEDHLRIQVTRSGFDLQNVWRKANQLDDLIEQHLNYAFNPRWGYLTACPANVGTGMRVSVVLHLPGLVTTDRISERLRGLNRANISARQILGDKSGSEFFRIGNQTTLGFGEIELIQQVTDVIPGIVEAERNSRFHLLAEDREGLRAEVSTALRSLLLVDLDDASLQTSANIVRLLSRVRLGVGMDLLNRIETEQVIVKFELCKLRRKLVAAVSEEDYLRASSLRDRILFLEGGSP